jgi:hypothetical protein
MDRRALHGQCAADGAGIAGELAPPEVVAHDRAGQPASRPVVAGREEPAERRREAERREVVAAHPEAADVVQFAGGREIESLVGPREQRGEGLLPFAQPFPQRIGDRRVACMVDAHGCEIALG